MSTQELQDAGPRAIRFRTIVFGLAALAVAGVVLVATLADITVNGTAVALAVLIGAGALLLAAGVLAAVREANGGPGGPSNR
jgi:hypothetical protein